MFIFLLVQTKKGENIYLGPHGAPSSQSRQQELNLSSRRQRFKQKLKQADRRIGGAGRENKVENLKELVGGGKASPQHVQGFPRDWLDPHCDESQFEKSYP
ncbi:cysteine synthase 2-like isoform X1 [Hibiscus syriacus]|uniref:Cysteine synthase 2-like isoform X1 n=1 Tax=Hibiscus syriacus TaxID=106335 RepID=A0A6A2YFY6_HIBSY|nr:cysteine synthase 2-like isoform X1 [Hibiscus syriacus]